MAQEFTINSSAIETKINQLLPSQGGFGAGVDFSASTMVIPIVDLTESAEGSNLRQDLQSSFSINSSAFIIANTTTTIINTTGFFRIFGFYKSQGASPDAQIQITDGTTTKNIVNIGSTITQTLIPLDFNIFLRAGDSCVCVAAANAKLNLTTRQIADIDGNLTNP